MKKILLILIISVSAHAENPFFTPPSNPFADVFNKNLDEGYMQGRMYRMQQEINELRGAQQRQLPISPPVSDEQYQEAVARRQALEDGRKELMQMYKGDE